MTSTHQSAPLLPPTSAPASPGYLLPGEIRFVVTNLDELLENGGEAETEIAEEGL